MVTRVSQKFYTRLVSMQYDCLESIKSFDACWKCNELRWWRCKKGVKYRLCHKCNSKTVQILQSNFRLLTEKPWTLLEHVLWSKLVRLICANWYLEHQSLFNPSFVTCMPQFKSINSLSTPSFKFCKKLYINISWSVVARKIRIEKILELDFEDRKVIIYHADTSASSFTGRPHFPGCLHSNIEPLTYMVLHTVNNMDMKL